METKKDLLNFCIDAVFYDYKKIEAIQELNQVRKCIINSFYETILCSRILVSLSIMDDIILKNVDKDVESILKDNHNLKANIIDMLTSEKTIRDEKQTVGSMLNDDDQQ